VTLTGLPPLSTSATSTYPPSPMASKPGRSVKVHLRAVRSPVGAAGPVARDGVSISRMGTGHWPGSTMSIRFCSLPSPLPPTAGSAPVPGRFPGPARRSSTGAGTSETGQIPSRPRWRRRATGRHSSTGPVLSRPRAGHPPARVFRCGRHAAAPCPPPLRGAPRPSRPGSRAAVFDKTGLRDPCARATTEQPEGQNGHEKNDLRR
jgi:hypothetical protein